MRNIFKYIPMVTLGQILGTVVGFPLLIFLINIFYYSNKYYNPQIETLQVF